MCDLCYSVDLIRRYPKNYVTADTTPEEYLINKDLSQGLYDIIDTSTVTANPDVWRSEVVGYYVEYRGARGREYSQPMFTFKPANDDCRNCAEYPNDEIHLSPRYAYSGCECGNIAYAAMDCPDHPLPSVDSRWVRKNQSGNDYCNHCEKRLPQEVWHPDYIFYCNAECKRLYDAAYEKRMAEWREKRGVQ